jgi:hypothetical protein
VTKFDELFATAAPLILRGAHQRDRPPREGGRWPVSVVLRPPIDSDLAQRLDAVTAEAAELAGPGHWQTGQLGSAHLTVRALEGYRATIAPDDPAIERYLSALRRAAIGPTQFRVTGLTLTPGSVMACAIPLDGAADAFMDRFATELGPDDWFERPYGRRDIWYLNLVHFTSAIANPLKLIDWVAERRTTTIGEVEIGAPELVRFCLQDGGSRADAASGPVSDVVSRRRPLLSSTRRLRVFCHLLKLSGLMDLPRSGRQGGQ